MSPLHWCYAWWPKKKSRQIVFTRSRPTNSASGCNGHCACPSDMSTLAGVLRYHRTFSQRDFKAGVGSEDITEKIHFNKHRPTWCFCQLSILFWAMLWTLTVETPSTFFPWDFLIFALLFIYFLVSGYLFLLWFIAYFIKLIMKSIEIFFIRAFFSLRFKVAQFRKDHLN